MYHRIISHREKCPLPDCYFDQDIDSEKSSTLTASSTPSLSPVLGVLPRRVSEEKAFEDCTSSANHDLYDDRWEDETEIMMFEMEY
jgi:hypothetical protein